MPSSDKKLAFSQRCESIANVVIPLKQKTAHRAPTLAVVAKEAGVSKETVSHILGKKADRYHEETRRRVIAAAKKLNYRPHRAAQIMRGGKSNMIGIIHFGISHQNAYKASHYLPKIIQESGYDTFVVDLSWLNGKLHRAIDLLVQSRVEGVIIAQQALAFGRKEVELLVQAGIPVVSLAGNETLGIPAVYGDSSVAIQDITRHLISLGHRSLLLLANTYESRPTLGRIAGFKRGIAEAEGCLVEKLGELRGGGMNAVRGTVMRLPAEVPNFDPAEIPYHFIRQLVAEDLLPDAVLCSNDVWAQGVFSAALEAGLRIPQDLAVTGFDNAAFGSHAPYYLTTAEPNIAEESAKAVEILLELIAGRQLPEQHYVFPCAMVVRRSCGATPTKSPDVPQLHLPL